MLRGSWTTRSPEYSYGVLCINHVWRERFYVWTPCIVLELHDGGTGARGREHEPHLQVSVRARPVSCPSLFTLLCAPPRQKADKANERKRGRAFACRRWYDDEEDELSEVQSSHNMPVEVKDWLSSTFSRCGIECMRSNYFRVFPLRWGVIKILGCVRDIAKC